MSAIVRLNIWQELAKSVCPNYTSFEFSELYSTKPLCRVITIKGTKTKCKYHYFNLECSKGNYGMKCNELCGSCSNISNCSHVDGTCRTGCSPGYRHNLCKNGMGFCPCCQPILCIHAWKCLRILNILHIIMLKKML